MLKVVPALLIVSDPPMWSNLLSVLKPQMCTKATTWWKDPRRERREQQEVLCEAEADNNMWVFWLVQRDDNRCLSSATKNKTNDESQEDN